MPTTDTPPEIARYLGEDQFGPAYRIMLADDAHAPGCVDRVLLQRMIRLGAATVDYLYASYTPTTLRYRHGSRPELERLLGAATAGATAPEELVDGIARWCAVIAQAAHSMSPDDLRLGGTEEAIVRRGTDWCTALARVGCVLCQVAGLPARLVYLFNTTAAYSGHAIVEVLRWGCWGCVDVVHGVVLPPRRRHAGVNVGAPARPAPHCHPPAAPRWIQLGCAVPGRRHRELLRVGSRPVRLHGQRTQRLLPLHPGAVRARLAGRPPLAARRGRLASRRADVVIAHSVIPLSRQAGTQRGTQGRPLRREVESAARRLSRNTQPRGEAVTHRGLRAMPYGCRPARRR